MDAFGLEDIDLDADFFDLGGNSLSAVQQVSRVRDTYGVDLGVSAIFEFGTIRAMAAELESVLAAGGAHA